MQKKDAAAGDSPETAAVYFRLLLRHRPSGEKEKPMLKWKRRRLDTPS